MKLTTFQHIDALIKIINEGSYKGCDKHAFYEDDEGFKFAYDFMRKKLGSDSMVWAWHTFDGNRDINIENHKIQGKVGQPYVMIELDVSKDRVLLSDFDNWHFCLMGSAIPDDEKSDDWLLLEGKEAVKTWDKVFDVKNSEYIQAVISEIRLEDITYVKFFTTEEDIN